jgi:hypothetical protein
LDDNDEELLLEDEEELLALVVDEPLEDEEELLEGLRFAFPDVFFFFPFLVVPLEDDLIVRC